MKINKLDRFETKTTLEPSPEQIQQAKEWAVNRIMETYVRLPANPAPVLESYQDLLNEMRHGVKRQPTIIQNDFSKITHAEPTKMNAKVDTGINTKVDTFTDFELEVLRTIQENGK
jgi:hypothetical protein